MMKLITLHKTDHGFTLLELLIVILIVALGTTWALPQYRRQIARSQLDQYTQKIESGFFLLRARQSAEGTSCEINFDSRYVGIANNNNWGTPIDLLELSHLPSDQRNNRLQCCDATRCTWDPAYRLMDQEKTELSRSIELKVSKDHYSLSPPGTSTDESSLIILTRSKTWHDDKNRPIPEQCIELSTTGHLHRGTWEGEKCRRR